MRFSLTSLIRLISLLAVVFSMLAIGLSKAVPVENGGYRRISEPRFVGVNGSMFTPPLIENFLLDRENGALTRSPFSKNDYGLDYASIAPWTGEKGEIEVVGRYNLKSKTSKHQRVHSLGIARLDYKSGSVLDSAPLEPVITGTPCWLPGPTRKVVFPAGDSLYIQEFPNEIDEPSPPLKISAHAVFPNADRVVFQDVFSPSAAEFDGRILVSLSVARNSTMEASQIWSIRLDTAGATIISAERMIDDSDTTGSERVPSVSKTPDGRVVLAYLKRQGTRGNWTLKLAQVRFDVEGHVPRIVGRTATAVEHHCAVNRPEFSSDGRFVHRVRKGQPLAATLDRVAVMETLDAGPTILAGGPTR